MPGKIFILSILFLLAGCQLSGQVCVPDPAYTNTSTQAGIYPDSITNFAVAYVDSVYNQVITIVVPPDTQVIPSWPPIDWDSTRLDSVQGLPASMSLACAGTTANTSRCSWIGNSIGCAKISGTPAASEIGQHPLKFYTSNFLGGQTTPNPYVISYYKIIIMPSLGVSNTENESNILYQNSPNPFAAKSDIKFYTENAGKVSLHIFNMMGSLVKTHDLQAKSGINKYELNGNEFDAGMYFYSVVQYNATLTRKMIVNK